LATASRYFVNWRGAPRLRVSFGAQAKREQNESKLDVVDISLDGCRLLGPVMGGRGDELEIQLSAQNGQAAWSGRARIVRELIGGMALAFKFEAGERKGLAQWLETATSQDPVAQNLLRATPERLALDSPVTVVEQKHRLLTSAEEELVERLKSSPNLRAMSEHYGLNWRLKMQPLFTLVPEGFVRLDEGSLPRP
jgi:hypothetical protein